MPRLLMHFHLPLLRIAIVAVALLSAAAFSLGAVTAAGAQGEPTATAASLEEYVAALELAAETLQADGDARTLLADARGQLNSVGSVLLPSGAELALTPLLGADGDDLSLATAQARIATVLAQLDASGGDNTAARLAVLSSVLSGPAFQQGESLWDRFVRWLAEWLGRLLPDPAPSSPAATAVSNQAGEAAIWVIGIAGGIAIVLLLAYWLRGLLTSFVANAEADRSAGSGEDLPHSPAEARQRAVGAAGAGDYRTAVRNLYLSALLTLEQQGLVPADRSLTNREVLSRVGTTHPLRPHFQGVVDTFDDVWYGVHEPDAGTYAGYTHSIDELEALAQQASKEVGP
jgi:hypothetical protein